MSKWTKKQSCLFNQKSRSITTQQVLGHDVHIVNPGRRSLALLKKAYDDVYVPAFPIADERDDLELWLDRLTGKDAQTSVSVVIAGENLNSKNPVIKAISVAEYYPAEDVGLMRYNAVDPAYRNDGFGRVMLEARKQALLQRAEACGKPLQGIFVQVNDPAKITSEQDNMDPALRIKIFEKWGARQVPFDCLLPPLVPGAEKCDFLKLLSYPHPRSGQYPGVEAVKAYMSAIYQNLDPAQPPQQNPDFHEVLRRIDAMKNTPAGRDYTRAPQP